MLIYILETKHLNYKQYMLIRNNLFKLTKITANLLAVIFCAKKFLKKFKKGIAFIKFIV